MGLWQGARRWRILARRACPMSSCWLLVRRFSPLLLLVALPALAGAQPPGHPAEAKAAAASSGSDVPGQDPVLAAMSAELERSRKELRLEGYETPYFISYQVGEIHRKMLSARFGAVIVDGEARNRQAHVEVRVGDYGFDSSGVDATDYDRYVAYVPDEVMPLEDDPAAVRGTLWLLTEQRYKQAITSYLKRKAQRVYEVKKDAASFSSEPPVRHRDPPRALQLDEAAWSERLRRVSTQMCRRPTVIDSSIRLMATRERRWQVNTEGSQVLTERLLYSLQIGAYSRAEDGMLLENERSYYADLQEGLPGATKLQQDVDQMLNELEALRDAELFNPYVGPAILEPDAAGVLFHEAIGHRLEGHRQKEENEGQTFKGRLGTRILPEFLNVSDDPTLPRWGTQS
ncbi:MAG: hypothetical protein FJ125_17870, partial [Deltaproteobacteria bacterium]|nr:hypothetical protein [Deltaproteobacteria bacterium]